LRTRRHEELLREVVSTQYFAVLNTIGQGLPYSNLVSFAATDDLRSLVFVTGRNTRKYRNIQDNHNISLLIDNRTNKPSDTSRAIAIAIIGTAREEIDNKSPLQDILLARHPQLRHFVEAPDNAVMLVTVQEYIVAAFDKTQSVPISQ
jgi:nitroimidazol reductase NimA-like FMN-containing flavoprotein (pyridoxamine 5'-phosphate oxidase superfamily)